MAKITSPLFSHSASGRVAEKLVFSLRSSGQQVRLQEKQVDILTDNRTKYRDYYSQAVSAWNLLNNIDKSYWVSLAQSKNYTGYNLFIKNYIDSLILAENKAIFGVAIYGVAIYGFS